VNGDIRNILQEAETRISGQGFQKRGFQDKDFRNEDLKISGFRGLNGLKGLNRSGMNRIVWIKGIE